MHKVYKAIHGALMSTVAAAALLACPATSAQEIPEAEAGVDMPVQPCAPSGPECVHPETGLTAESADGEIRICLVDKIQYYPGGDPATRCRHIISPKSVHISPDGRKFYVNSLEGGTTVVFDTRTRQMLKVISHRIGPQHDALWAPPAEDLYEFTHYPKSNHFMGKPVESTFSHNGRYLWVPYYRRSYDINAQDPSACAVIDTSTDSIIRLFETGPLPKMIATSPDGKLIAISHWGDNTVGIIDISSDDPAVWHHKARYTVDYRLRLDYPLDTPVDRDTGSGYALRGTVFTPDGRYLLVGCMGGGGGIAVIDLENGKYMGRVTGMMANVRHLLIDGEWLYLSVNKAGYVQRCRLADFIAAAEAMGERRQGRFTAWENAKVGTGARTIEISPDGRYIFAVCNSASELCVVDTRTMQQVCAIQVDSYPVGLDISDDGRYIYTTSQGRDSAPGSGNAVDIFEVHYKGMPPVVEETTEDPTAAASDTDTSRTAHTENNSNDTATDLLIPVCAAALALIAALCWIAARKRRKQ